MKGYKRDEAELVVFSGKNGNIERQAVAVLTNRLPDYEIRFYRARPDDDEYDVVYVLKSNHQSIYVAPDGDILLPTSAREMEVGGRSLSDIFRRDREQPVRAVAWVAATIEHAEKIATSDGAKKLFWIHLHETLVAVQPWLERTRNSWEDEPSDDDARLARIVEAAEAAKALVRSLADRDRLVLSFFRHHAAHFAPHVFDLTAKDNVALLGRRPTDIELQDLREANEGIEARAISARTLEPLQVLLRCLEAWLAVP